MDNHHVQISPSFVSCGILNLSSLTSDPRKMAYACASYLYHPARGRPAAFLHWSDVDRAGSNGRELAAFLSEVLRKPNILVANAENPITTNNIVVYLMVIPHEIFKEWYIKERIERAKKV